MCGVGKFDCWMYGIGCEYVDVIVGEKFVFF